jgi:glycosyltransferase involved in cell wall biosynthesis
MSRAASSHRMLMTLATATGSGAGEAALHFCEALRRDGWCVDVVWGPPVREQDGVAATAAMRAAGVDVHQLDRTIAPTWPVWMRLQPLAKALRPTAVIGVMQRDRPVAMALSRWLDVPGIVAAQNQHVFWGSPAVSVAKRLLYRFALKRWASLVVCTSEAVRREILGFGVANGRTVVLPNGIALGERRALSPQDRDAARAELGAGPTDLLLINVGRLDVQKGQDILVDAFTACARSRPHVRLALVGDVSAGPNQKRMAVFAADLRSRVRATGVGERIVFAGWRSDVARLLQASDAYVHAARWEGFSFAMLEAFAAALPVVITDCSGYPDGFVEARHGWVVPREDSHALATAIGRLVDLTPEARSRMGLATRELVEAHYDIRTLGAQFAEFVSQTVLRGR